VPFEDRVAERKVGRAALASPGSEEAASLLLNVVYGFTSAEIAAIIGIAPEPAKKRLSCAKQRLRAAYVAENR
jgi:DNA-directed RNA polymerase specialized sigma24 family protein